MSLMKPVSLTGVPGVQGVLNITRRYDLGDSGTFVPTWVLVASWIQVHSPANTTTQVNLHPKREFSRDSL